MGKQEQKTGWLQENLFWGILFVIGLVCIWTTQRAVPVMMDDEWYSTILQSEQPLSSLKDIWNAQIWHYNNWGGRTVAHTIAQLIFLFLSEEWADVLNTAMIVLLSWMINRLTGEKRLAFLTLTIGFLHGLNANWKMSMYWQTGACNYLYTTILILAFLWLYLGKPSSKFYPVLAVLAPLLGVLAGWTNENMGPAVWVITVLVIWKQCRKRKLEAEPTRIPFWMILGSAGCLAGSILMILAPGNSVRSAEVASSSYGTLWQIFLRMYSICRGLWEYLFPVILITAFLIFINVCVMGNRLKEQELLLLVCALLSWGAMILSPHYPDRAAFGTMCLLLCVISSQAGAIFKNCTTRFSRIFLAGIGVFIWLKGMYVLGEFLAISWGWIR